MKKLLLSSLTGLMLLGLAFPLLAADEAQAKERTVKGEAMCAKCALHQSDKCQTVIQAENRRGKKITYYLADNDVAKKFHHDVCQENKKVTATGTVKTVDGKRILTVTKIEPVKD
ncbi:MAG TPA: DUF6370 family protein [Verrucomicrobiae bacterium]|nr:DUF6370 family protein [Verrucomicrobiae bacterium]